MTQEKLQQIIELKEKIEQLERVLEANASLLVGSLNQNSGDYYKAQIGSCLHIGVRDLLNKELEDFKMKFEKC